MDMEKVKEAVVFKQEGLMFSVSLDGKKLIKDVLEKAVSDAVAASATKYDDQLWAFLEPYIDAYLASK